MDQPACMEVRDQRNLLGARTPALMAVLLMTVSLGCASSNWVTVRPIPQNPLATTLNLVSPGGPRPSDRSMLLLRRYALDGSDQDPAEVLTVLREVNEREPSADKVYSLAELSYLAGKKTEATNPQRALEMHGASVMHAYTYLFDARFSRLRNAYDPQFRGACDLYNAALESALRIVKKQHRLLPGSQHTIQAGDQTIDVAVMLRSTAWRAEDFERLEFVSDYEIKGLRNQYHYYGLGVPLIAVRKTNLTSNPAERYYPPGLSFPVTAFLRFIPKHQGSTHHLAAIELYDPLNVSDVAVAGRRIPLESDLSTPLAYFLDQPSLRNLDIATTGLLRPEESLKTKGLYMVEPFQPGKIPVLMVHGLWSSPITWMEMFNDLRSTPEIRDRYQFWFYLYPTGQPFWYSAAQLRADLVQMRTALDPQRQDPALDQMVLVGHSMGGLVSKMQTIDSGEALWNVNSDKPFTLVKATNEVRQNLADTYFFRPNISIRRVITIGTPHRGSNFANNTTRWLGSKLITLPTMLVRGRQQVERDNPGIFRSTNLLDIPTSIDSLSPSCPIFPVLLTSKKMPWVKYHNIVGRVPQSGFLGRVAGDSDGIVPFASAHLDDVQSELVVEGADHTKIHSHPRSVLEVRRILREHLAELNGPIRSPLERLPWTAMISAQQGQAAAVQPASAIQAVPAQPGIANPPNNAALSQPTVAAPQP